MPLSRLNSNRSFFSAAPGTATPRWSHDGQMIAFSSNPEGRQDIYVVPAAGGRPKRLTSHPANDIIPSFSADNQWIYFSRIRGGESNIWKVPVSGGAEVQVTQNVGWVALESPDGAAVYYTETSGPQPSPLWRLSTDVARRKRLSTASTCARSWCWTPGSIMSIRSPARRDFSFLTSPPHGLRLSRAILGMFAPASPPRAMAERFFTPDRIRPSTI